MNSHIWAGFPPMHGMTWDNYRHRAKILLAMPFDLVKSGEHEVCSSVHNRFHCVCVANIRGFATAFSVKTGAAI
jgi:hypothetical protein